MMAELVDNPRRKWRKLGFSGMVGALAGFAAASAALALGNAGMLGELSVSQEIALLVSVMYLLMGIAVGFGAVSPRIGAKFLNVEDADELREERRMLVPSAIGCIALALGLAALALSGVAGIVPPHVALALFGLTVVVTIWLSVQSRRNADEYMRDVMRDGAAYAFYFVFAGLGGWAVLSHLGFAAMPGMLDIVTLFYALTLVGSFWAVGRRGMLIR